MNKQITIKHNIEELEKIFYACNEYFYEGCIDKPVITLIPNQNHKLTALGWCSASKIWSLDNQDSFYEICVCPEFMDRSLEDIVETMLHEMVHLFNLMNDIKDCSRNGTYHNKRFEQAALHHGLLVEKTSKYGYSQTSLNDAAKEFVKTLTVNITPLIRYSPARNSLLDDNKNHDEEDEQEKKKRKKSKKYICPVCEISVRATKEVNIKCADCDCMMELEE